MVLLLYFVCSLIFILFPVCLAFIRLVIVCKLGKKKMTNQGQWKRKEIRNKRTGKFSRRSLFMAFMLNTGSERGR